MNQEATVVFIVNVQPEKQDDGKYVARVSAIRKSRRSYSPYMLEIEDDEFFTALAAVEHGRLAAHGILHERVPEADIQFVDWKEDD